MRARAMTRSRADGGGTEIARRWRMRSVASVLAHVLASASLVACGGRVSGVDDPLSAPSPAESTEPPTRTPSTLPSSSPANPPPAPTTTSPSCVAPPAFLKTTEMCSDLYTLACGVPSEVNVEDGLDMNECKLLCGTPPTPMQSYWGCQILTPTEKTAVTVECYTCVAGRRPAGYGRELEEGTVAAWLAHTADLERVSVDAFCTLARELSHHRAPAALVRAAHRAARDEVRHARDVGALAVLAGATLSTEPVQRQEARDLEALALENAVEGCVRETYGALVAAWQAGHAGREDVRRVMAPIAREEAQHADLAWRVHAWAMPRLSVEARARVEAALAGAVDELARAAHVAVAPELVSELGLPRPGEAARLVRGLRAELFATALAA